jgi:hypothetical protein
MAVLVSAVCSAAGFNRRCTHKSADSKKTREKVEEKEQKTVNRQSKRQRDCMFAASFLFAC